MKAIVCKKYGSPDVLQLAEVEKPMPKDDQILVKVFASSVSSGDARIRALNVPQGFGLMMRLAFGIRKPRKPIMGADFAGIVEGVGRNVKTFQVGDEVFGTTEGSAGTYAEYFCMAADKGVVKKPANVTFAEAAAAPFGANTAVYFLRDVGKIKRGDKLLIIGASGSVGTAAVQIAKHFGAEVTGVCSGKNTALVKMLGADHVVDYTQQDVTQLTEKYDLILETVDALSMAEGKLLLKPSGIYLQVVAGLPDMLRGALDKQVKGGTVFAGKDEVVFLKELLETGALKPVIDSCYPLAETAEAHRRVDTGRKVGNVVITVREA